MYFLTYLQKLLFGDRGETPYYVKKYFRLPQQLLPKQVWKCESFKSNGGRMVVRPLQYTCTYMY